MKMKKCILIILSLVSLFPVLRAQQVTVSDRSDLNLIPGVTITNEEKTIMAVTDGSGKADISAFGEQDNLLFNHVAFQSLQIKKSDLAGMNYKVYLTDNIIRLDELVISANKVEERKVDVPNKIERISLKEIRFINPQTSAILLEQTGNVFVQQSQLGGGSPVLRGFESNKVLLMIDGVRMNNAIYRGGHLQNAITVDPLGLASTEILYGPGSVIYGSDALGGVISFTTQDPLLSSNGKFTVHGDFLGRYSSANVEKTGGANLSFGWKKVGVLVNFSYSDFDDLRAGKVRNPFYGDWGKCLYSAERINGADSMVVNGHPEIQRHSGYSQYNFLGKILFKPGKNSRYVANVQYTNSSNISRYDRLTEMSGGKLKYAEWYYGPQKRLLTSILAEYNLNAVIFDKATFLAAYQNIGEDRISRSFGKSTKKYNLEKVSVFSFNADFDKNILKKDDLRYGLEYYYNNVVSRAHQQNIRTGINTENLSTRYPDDKANMMSFAGYLSNNWKVAKSFSFSQGIRFSYVALNAAYSDTMMKIMKFPFDKNIEQKNSAINGYLGLTLTPGRDWKFSGIVSTGFRAPNIDDLTKLSESSSTDKVIIVPNPDLKPEYATNLDITIGKTILGKIRLEGTFFYTWLTDALVVAPSTYNGQDSLLYDGVVSKVMSSANAGKARIYGFQGNLLAQVTRTFSIVSNLTYTVGEIKVENIPLDHIPPVYGMTSFQLELKKFRGSFYLLYNGWKRLSQYNLNGEDNEAYATVYGMPSWYTLNLKASYQVVRFVNVELGLENILDEHYRKFASGISAPGRNLIVALRASF
jgi:hemoglobin/transferrin/lactoferrin receptor protein